MLKNTTIFFLLLLFCCQLSQAQILKNLGNKLKDKANSTLSKSDNNDVLIKAAVTALKKSYAKKDSTSMNLALSSYDNVSFYSDRKGADNALRYGSTLISQMGDYEFNREDEGKSTAELAGLSNPFSKKNKNETKSITNSYKSLNDEQYQLLKQAETLNQTGELSYSSRFFDYANTSFLGATVILSSDELLEKSLLHAKVKSNLGMLAHSIGDFSSSESYFLEALDIIGRAGLQNDYLYAVIANNQAILLKDQGKFNSSETQLNGVISVFEGLGDKGIKASLIAKNNLAILYQYLGRTEEAIALLEKIIENTTDWGEKSNTYQRVNINLALIYENVGNIKGAEEIYLKALALKKKQRRTKQPDYASILTNLSSLYLNNGQTDKDINGMLSEATAIYQKQYGEEHPTLVTVNRIKVSYLISTSKYSEAVNMARKNYQLSEKLYGENHPKQNKAAIQLAYAEWKNNDPKNAQSHFFQALDQNIIYIKDYFPAMSEVEKGKFWQTLQSDFHSFYSFAFADGSQKVLQKVLEYETVTKGLLLSTSGKIRKQILESGNSTLVSNYNDWKSAKNQLAYYYGIPKEELSKQNVNLDSIAKAANEKERWLSANTNLFNQKESKPQLDIQSNLTNNEALVDIIKYYNIESQTYQYGALIVTQQSLQAQLINEAKQLETKSIKLYKNAIKYKKVESKSYDAFWSQIQSQLAGIDKIYLVKDGVFNQLSTGSLYDGQKYMADHFDITVLTNPQDLDKVKSNKGLAKSMFLMGSPAFNTDKYSPLPGTLIEVNSIAGIASKNQLKTTKFIEKEATEANFSKSTNADVLHVATHGFFIDRKPDQGVSSGETIVNNNALDALMRSGIVLAEQGEQNQNELTQNNDGIVTAYEISTLDFPSTELVVLSACETGLGEIKTGEGVYGLQRSFLVAGAKSVVMSLWKVDDNATKEFMITFYQNWLTSGKKHESFNQAKRQLKRKYKEAYYWGAFVLIEG